jgi:uncharacterized protein (DUF2252 family)
MTDDVSILMRQRPSRDERRKVGASVRQRVPLASLADCPAPAERTPSTDIIEAQNATRNAELVPLRYERMGADAFSFLRGTAAVMARDLSLRPHSGLDVQLCGDAHLDNFGIFASAERRLTFDLTDFDETLPGPFEFDVKRLAASFATAARVNSMGDAIEHRAAKAVGRAYREWMATFNERPTLDVWFARADLEWMVGEIQKPGLRDAFLHAGERARTKDGEKASLKLTERVGDEWHFRSDPPTLVPLTGTDHLGTVADVFRRYRETLPPDRVALLDRYSFVEAAVKVVGVGSVGTRAYALLFQSGDGEPLILQAKQADASVFEMYLQPSEFDHHGKRVVVGQRLIQSSSDPFLGWTRGDETLPFDFYFRQLWDMKGRIEATALDASSFEAYASVCAGALARAHARAGDASLITGYLDDGTAFDHAIADYARSYTDLMISDYAAFEQWRRP